MVILSLLLCNQAKPLHNQFSRQKRTVLSVIVIHDVVFPNKLICLKKK